MISGCKDEQTSSDAYINNNFQGAMTWSFLESIKRHPELRLDNIVSCMRSLLQRNKYKQIPQLSCSKDFDIKNKFL